MATMGRRKPADSIERNYFSVNRTGSRLDKVFFMYSKSSVDSYYWARHIDIILMSIYKHFVCPRPQRAQSEPASHFLSLGQHTGKIIIGIETDAEFVRIFVLLF